MNAPNDPIETTIADLTQTRDESNHSLHMRFPVDEETTRRLKNLRLVDNSLDWRVRLARLLLVREAEVLCQLR